MKKVHLSLPLLASIATQASFAANARVEPKGPMGVVAPFNPGSMRDGYSDQPAMPQNGSDGMAATLNSLVGSTLADVEREFIEVTIRQCDGSIPKAARILDVSPSTLYRKREAWERTAS